MNTITIHRLSLQFDADQITHGLIEEQAQEAVELINAVLQRQPLGLSAQLFALSDEIEVESSICQACEGKGWIKCNVGNDDAPRFQIQRCDACEQYDNDAQAQEAAARESFDQARTT
jgi:thymidine kinase